MRIDRPEHYFDASLQRNDQALRLYQQGASYAAAMYLSGLAVECMLRAFKLQVDPSFDEKHDLLRLFDASRFGRVDRDLLRGRGMTERQIHQHEIEIFEAINVVARLWHNSYRFASEERLRSHLKGFRVDRRVKGDILKFQALSLLEAADVIIAKGTRQWISSKRWRPS